MEFNKPALITLVFLLSAPVFIWLDTGFNLVSASDLIGPIAFSASLTFSVNYLYRRFFLISSIILFGFMVLFYLFSNIEISSWFGGLGLGILLAYFIGLLPEIIKKGFVEKL